MRPACLPLLLTVVLATTGHVGSPVVIHQAQAGPYGLRIQVAPPAVVPGRAEVFIEVQGGVADQVLVTAFRRDVGLAGAPRPEPATPLPSREAAFRTEVWLMSAAPHGIVIRVSGPKGKGEAIVPVTPLLTRRANVSPGLAIAFLLVGGGLIVGLVRLAGRVALEGRLGPGAVPDTAAVERSARVQRRAGLIAGGLFLAWALWWAGLHRSYARRLYRPPGLEARVAQIDGRMQLTLQLRPDSAQGRSWSPLVEDHGHFMHLILVAEDDLAGMAHLHPARVRRGDFTATLPTLPAGGYRLYADILHRDGLAETLTGRVELTGSVQTVSRSASNPGDDSWWRGYGGSAAVALLPVAGGTVTMTGPGGSIHAGEPVVLAFQLDDSAGAPLVTQPYLGMAGHAIVVKQDGSVYVHLHPTGTVSAAQAGLFSQDGHEGHFSGSPPRAGFLAFPYSFPEPGRFRIWVQFRTGTGVETVAYDLGVDEESRLTRRRGERGG